MDPIFWLGLSVFCVAIGIAAVLLTLIPALRELGRAAQSAEKLFDTLNRELPPTLEAIRLTSLELTELTDDLTDSIQSMGQVAQQVDSTVSTAKAQAKQVTVTSKSVAAGFKAAWQSLTSETASETTSETANETASEIAKEITSKAPASVPHPSITVPEHPAIVAASPPTASPPTAPETPAAKSASIDDRQ
jgi:methyl-accepting chemotaxis protein